jgi:hypothetical protein
MNITQISVFLENRKGRLAEVCSLFGENDINIRALTIAETESFGVMRLVVDKPSAAVEVLKNNGFTANLTNVVAVEVEDAPGGLARILQVVAKNELNIEYMYGFIEKFSDKALMVFRFDNPHAAANILIEKGINVASKDDIQKL